jgi:hypothetical protein
MTGMVGVSAASSWGATIMTLTANGVPLAAAAHVTASSSSFVLTSKGGTVSCPDTALTGTLTTNGEKKTDTIKFDEAVMAGPEEGGLCSSTFSAPLNEATMTAVTLPWRLTLSTKGAATVGKIEPPENKYDNVEFKLSPLEAPKGGHPALSCLFSTEQLKGTFAANGEPITTTFPQQAIRRDPDDSTQCGIKSKVSSTLTLNSEGAPIRAVLESTP